MNKANKDNTSSSKGVLSGLKVVELGHYIAAPLATQLLAEQGAEVIHIVPPNRKTAYPILDAILERGKDQLELDLNIKQNVGKLKDLVREADIVVTNYSPGTLETFGIDLNAIREEFNPGLINCHITPFPEWDKRNKYPGWEAIPGMEGFLYEQPLKSPVLHSFPVGSVLSAMYAATAIVATLYSRLSDGLGQKISVNLHESDLSAQVLQILVFNGAPRSFMPLKMVGSPFMGVWKCADDRYIYLHITIPKHNEEILELIRKNGYERQIEKLYEVMSEQTREDPSMVSSVNEAKEIKRIMREIYLSKTADEWEELLGKDFCCIKVRILEEWVDESIESNNQDCKIINDPVFGELRAPGPAVIAGGRDTVYEERTIGEVEIENIINKWKNQNDQAINKPPSSPRAAKKSFDEEKAPLDGVKIFDMSRVIAGPFSARILAELGADVVSVQRPKRLDWALSFHVLFNAGKDSVTLDFTTSEGKETLWKLMRDYDPNVFIQNYRSMDFTREIGMGPETIEKVIPNIVYTSVNAYGIEGEWQNRPAFEQVVQAVTGVQMEYVQGKKPKIFPFPILDMGSGLLSAFATLCGLYKQKSTGKGSFCHAHMTSMAMLLQITGFPKFQREKLRRLIPKGDLPFEYQQGGKIVTDIFRVLWTNAAISGPKRAIKQWAVKEGIDLGDDVSIDRILKRIQNKVRMFPPWFIRRKIRKKGFGDQIGFVKQRSFLGFAKRYMKNDKSKQPIISMKDYPALTELPFIRTPIHSSRTPLIDVNPTPLIGQQSEKYLKKFLEEEELSKHVLDYPQAKPLVQWLWNFIVWGVYSLRTGNI